MVHMWKDLKKRVSLHKRVYWKLCDVIDFMFRRTVAFILLRYIKYENLERCPEYNPGCPCCILYRAYDDLYQYGSDEEWLDLFNKQWYK